MANGKTTLTLKQKRFADYYIELGNGSEAIRKAKYKTKYPDKMASQLLGNPRVWEYIDKKISKKDAKRIMSQDEVLEELSLIARSKVTDYLKICDKEIIVGYENDEEGQIDKEKPIKKMVRVMEIFETDQMDSNKIGAISEIKETRHGMSFKLHDKVRALEALAKRYGLDRPLDIEPIEDISEVEEELFDD